MEDHKKRLLSSFIVISIIIIANLGLLILIYPNLYQGKLNIDSATRPVITSSLNPNSTLTSSPRVSPTPQKELSIKCVHSVNYWSSHTDTLPSELLIGSTTYNQKDVIAIYKKLITDLNDYLSIQMTTAYLNNINVTISSGINKTISDASYWLQNHPSGSQIIDPDRQIGYFLGVSLADFNNGKFGPPLCLNEPTFVPYNQITPPTSTYTSTATITMTFTPTKTPEDTNTPSNTPIPPLPPAQPPPSSTKIPTHAPLKPTNTPGTKPTDTPISLPTAARPLPSPTLISLPTPAPN